MTVAPIAPVQGVLPTNYVTGAGAAPVAGTDGSAFATSLTGA